MFYFFHIYNLPKKKKRTTSQTPRPPNSLPTTHAANFTAEHRFEKRFLPPIPRDLMAIIIFLAYHIEFMANKGRSNNRLAGPVGTEEVGPPIPRRSSTVGPGLYSRSQLAVVAIDMRAIDIWVHISQGWQVPRRALSLSLLPLSYLPPPPPPRAVRAQRSSSVQRDAAQQYSLGQPKIGCYPIRGPVNYARPLSTTLTRLWLEDRRFHEENSKEGGGLARDLCEENLWPPPSALLRLYGREPNEWASTVSKSGRQANWMFGMRAVKYFFHSFSFLFLHRVHLELTKRWYWF